MPCLIDYACFYRPPLKHGLLNALEKLSTQGQATHKFDQQEPFELIRWQDSDHDVKRMLQEKFMSSVALLNIFECNDD